jgi:hypothetical protein
MSSIELRRPFRRGDRDQLTGLVNAQRTPAPLRHGRAAEWLRLAHVDRLRNYAYLEGRDETGQGYDEDRAFLQASPFIELTRTQRGWTR